MAEVRLERDDEIVVAILSGEVDMSNATSVRQQIAGSVTPEDDALIVDLSSLAFIDSAGLHAVIELGTLLEDKPMHGYDLIRELEQRSGGMWRPSPGSVYPTLQMLEEEGLVSSEEQDGKRVFSLTDAGKTELEERRARGGEAPWQFGPMSEGIGQLREAAFQLAAAAMQVARTGSDPQRKQAAEILAEARKKLYGILAEG